MGISTTNDKKLTSAPVPGSLFDGLKDYLRNIRLFSRNARLYLAGSFLMGVNFHIFQLLLNLYLKEYGFVESQIGDVLSARAIGMTVIAIPAALLLSRIRLKPVLMIAAILYATFSFFITSYQQLLLLTLFSLLSGMAFTFYRVAAAPFFMRNSTQQERTHLFSFWFAMMILAGMVGSAGSGNLVELLADYTGDLFSGYRYTLYVGIGISLLSLIPFALIRASKPSEDESKITLTWDLFRERWPFYFKISISNFLVGMGAGLVIPFLNLYFRDRFGQAPDSIGHFYFMVHLLMLASILSGPVLVSRLGLVRAVFVTQLLSIPFMFVMAYTHVLALAVGAFVLRAALMNLGVPLVTNFGMELSQENERGIVNALLMIAWTSSWAVSSKLGGVLIENYGYTITINITIILYVVASLVFYGFFRKAEKKTDKVPRWTIVRENMS